MVVKIAQRNRKAKKIPRWSEGFKISFLDGTSLLLHIVIPLSAATRRRTSQLVPGQSRLAGHPTLGRQLHSAWKGFRRSEGVVRDSQGLFSWLKVPHVVR